ncbi:putative ankyrin repeat-containing domain, PGG domain, ankyrin repeat-containing domain superfamily [Helianthus annuus]|nr:putative ankyrin repeat-containing domain, PGG domain, ankyrin repeat-containing domain superfamily [Helianthus annuus]
MATHTTVTVQQPQASTGNNPCVDQLYGGRRDTIVRLYRASIEGNWEVAKDILQGDGELVKYRITENNETPLHVAAAAGHSTKFVGNLVNMMNDMDDFKLQNRDGNTAFCLAAISGNVSMAKIMIEDKKLALPSICGSDKMKPLYLAAFHGNHDMVNYLYGLFISNRQMGWTNDDMDNLLLKCVQAGIFDVAIRILEENDGLPQDKHAWNVLQVLARNPAAFHVRSWPIIRQITSIAELEEIVPPPCREVRNAEGKTPEELFKESHKDLVIRGMQWISETINQSMVVAALVCTIGFPGGYDQNNGLPILLQDRHFIAFIVMDAISFILSTSSILTFLSIILSRHQRNTELMLQKWVIGHLALLTSILAIVVAFGISFFILYRSAYKSTVPFIVYPSVIILVCLYVPVYFSLYTDAIKAIYSRRYLFRAKHMLYCKI